MNTKPCIIVYSKLHGRFEAWNEFGGLVKYSYISFHMLSMELEESGYEIVGLNSRIGRTILDKTNQHSL